MAHTLSVLRGATIHALDGDVGTLEDFYFDDRLWVVRYVVARTGPWVNRRHVVLSVMSLLAPDWESARVPVKLAREQIRNSPDIGRHPEVSRALEAQLLSYYGYPYYWAGDALWGRVSNPVLAAEESVGALPTPPEGAAASETHLHSCADVVGYHLHARDGEIGHVDDFLIDPTAWAIDALVIDTSNWIGGRSVPVAPSSIARVDWAARAVRVNLSRDTIASTAEHGTETERRA